MSASRRLGVLLAGFGIALASSAGCRDDFDAVFGDCPSGFANCNDTASDGCETEIASNAQACGACGRVCASGICSSGVCSGQEAGGGSGGSAGSGGGSGGSTGGTAGIVDAAKSYAQIVLDDDPIAYWRLGESQGPTAVDLRGSHDGLYEGTPIYGVTPGAITSDPNTAVSFTGKPTRVNIADDGGVFDFAGFTSFTIEAWVKQDASPEPSNIGHYHIASKRDDGLALADQRGYNLYFNNKTESSWFVFTFMDGISPTSVTSAKMEATEWRHVVASFNGGTKQMSLTIDAGPPATDVSNISLEDTPYPLTIGNSYGGGQWFGGAIDEVAIYDHVLRADRIQIHYLAGKAGGD